MTLIFSNASTQTEVLIRDKNGVSTPTVEGHNNVGGQSLDRDNGREKTALQPIEDEDPILRRLKPKCKEDVRLLFVTVLCSVCLEVLHVSTSILSCLH